jgi:hypothetical protein
MIEIQLKIQTKTLNQNVTLRRHLKNKIEVSSIRDYEQFKNGN